MTQMNHSDTLCLLLYMLVDLFNGKHLDILNMGETDFLAMAQFHCLSSKTCQWASRARQQAWLKYENSSNVSFLFCNTSFYSVDLCTHTCAIQSVFPHYCSLFIRLFSQLPSNTLSCARETCLPPHSLSFPVLLFPANSLYVFPPSCALMPIRLFLSQPKWQQAIKTAWLRQYYETTDHFCQGSG